jgi:hypothetical protein
VSRLLHLVCRAGPAGTGERTAQQRGAVVGSLEEVAAIAEEPVPAVRRLPTDAALAEAVQDVLGSYAWRTLTATVVAALAVAVVDRARDLRQPPVGAPALSPAVRDDERVSALADELSSGPRWRELTLREVARRLVAGLTAAEQRSLWLDLELAWLLEPPA